jgi:carbon storage regulator CsrA
MLVLSRKSQESVIVGSFDRPVKVTVLTIDGDKVTLGFEGDAEVPIHRFEVWE